MKPPADLTGRCWLILGASSAISRAFARAVAKRGADVILAGRDIEDMNATADDLRVRGTKVEVVAFDACTPGDRAPIVESCRRLVPDGCLDVFLGFAAMPAQAAMEEHPDLALSTILASYSGAVGILLALAPLLETKPGGHVLVIGSVSGDRGRVKNYVYGSAKAGLATFTAGLRARLLRAGVSVTLIKAGFLDTGMTWGMPGIFLAASPDRTAEAMLGDALRRRDTVYFPRFWALIMLIIRSIPERLFKRLSI